MKIQVEISDNKVVVSLDDFYFDEDIEELVKIVKDKLIEFNKAAELKVLNLVPSDSSKLFKFYCLDRCVTFQCSDPKFAYLQAKAKIDFRESNATKSLIDAILDLHYQQNV